MRKANLVLTALIALLVSLAVAGPAAALPLPPKQILGHPFPLTQDEEEAEASEEESEEEELEEEEIEEEEEDEEEGYPPPECLLQTARAQAFAYQSQNKVKLLIRYTSTEPTEAAVDYRLKGGKGSLKFNASKQHLAKSGLIRLSESLSEGEMAKAAAAKSFTVELRIPETPRYCRRYDTRHLTIGHGSGNRIAWLQSESIFGT